MRFRHLALLLLLLPSCHHGARSNVASMSSKDIHKAYHSKVSNPFQQKKRGWIADKMARIGLIRDKPSTQPVGTATSEVFKSNQ